MTAAHSRWCGHSTDRQRDDPVEPANRNLLRPGHRGITLPGVARRNGAIAVAHGTMLEEFDVKPEILEADLLRLSEAMRSKGLLEAVSYLLRGARVTVSDPPPSMISPSHCNDAWARTGRSLS